MAITTTTIVPTPIPVEYEGITELGQDLSIASRREIRFSISSETIAAAGAGDNQRLLITALPPQAFAHVLVDLSLIFKSEDGGSVNWPAQFAAFWNSNSTGETEQFAIEMRSQGTFATGTGNNERRVYAAARLPGAVFLPRSDAANLLNLNVINPTANDAAYEVTFFARMLEYNVRQAYHWRVNSMVPVRGGV